MHNHSFLVYDASAGSGKTYTLVKEYLKIIITSSKNDAYRNILAITFTNKAVNEMKSRIVESLSDFAKDNHTDKSMQLMKDIAADTGLSTEKIHEKAKQIIKHLIHNYASFDISTIDKFTHKVIRAFAFDLNLSMNFEVSLDTENLLSEAVDAVIAKAGEDDVLTKLLIDFTLEKADDDKSWDVSRDIFETGKLMINENNRLEIYKFKDKEIDDFMSVKAELKDSCNAIDKKNAELAQRAIALIDSNNIDYKSFKGGYLIKHIISIKECAYNPKNKTYHEVDDISINKTAKDRDIIANIVPELLEILGICYKNYKIKSYSQAFLKNITPLSLLNTLSKELSQIQTEQNVLSISEFNAIVHNELQNQPAPFIYERMGERYRHFFIDEFQDTSEMQWKNLIPLIDNAISGQDEAGEKGTLMIVGDPKQSIYRWRGGKTEQFIELTQDFNPFKNPDKQVAHLEKNFRSYSEIIEFNNAFFHLLSAQFTNEDYRDLYENHSAQITNDVYTGGYVNISFIPQDDSINSGESSLQNILSDMFPDEEKQKFDAIDIKNDSLLSQSETLDKIELYLEETLKIIKTTLENGFEYSDIAILTRKRRHGILLAKYLTEQGVPILSSETLMIQNSTEVKFIIAILKYLNNNSDIEAKVYFLYYLANKNNYEGKTIHDFIVEGKNLTRETAFEEWLSTFGISFMFEDVRKKSLYEAVETIVSKFITTSHSTSTSDAYIQYFLDIVLERDVKNQSGIADFLDFWDNDGHKYSIPAPEGKNAVQIMTIHKSKGLEFTVLIIPFAEENYANTHNEKLWLEGNDNINMPKILVDNNANVKTFGDDAEAIYTQKQQENLLDNINILYVALTRAKEQLYIISSMNFKTNGEPKENNMSFFFINYLAFLGVFHQDVLKYEFGSPKRLSLSVTKEDNVKYIEILADLLDFKRIKIANREATMWGTKQQESIEYGNIIHQILSYIQTKADVNVALERALEEGILNIGQKETVLKTLTSIVENKSLEEYFLPENLIFNEQTIVQKEGLLVKPDRIVLLHTGKMMLLEYKTGKHLPAHELQLGQYKSAIQSVGYPVEKMALVYIGEEIEVISC